jgi:hypothetical protein
MAWGKELTAEDLKKAGLDPADLAELKEKGVKKADLESLKTEMTTSMTELIKNQFTELETKLKPAPVQQQQQQQQDPPDDNNDFLTDPTGWTKKQVGQSIAFTAVQTTKMRMELALDRAKATNPLFKNEALTTEIMAEWSNYKPEHMAANKDFDPDKLLTKICNMVKGAHAEDIQRDTDKREGKFNMVASGGGGGGGNTNTTLGGDKDNRKPEERMTDFEKKQAARYGMTPEEWVNADKEMEDEIKLNESIVSKSLKDKVKVMQEAGV